MTDAIRTPAERALDALVEDVRARADDTSPRALRDALGQAIAGVALGPALADGLDVPGTAYERLVSSSHRRPAGQFATPFWAADVMARWLLAEPVRSLLDPGVGSGRLLFRALSGAAHEAEHVVGLDVDPLAIRMADLNLRARGSTRHDLRVGNFLLDDVGTRPDAITCNPPYSRHHMIPASDKEAIHEGFQRRLGLKLSRLAGLHVLFLVRAIEIATPGARIAFITPSDWLDVGYGDAVKRWMLERCRVDALIQLEANGLLFGRDVLTTATITLLKKGGPPGPTRLIRPSTRALPEPDAVVNAARGVSSVVEACEIVLARHEKWARRVSRSRTGVRLDELAYISRGIATGANRYFVFSEAMRLALELPDEVVRPCAVSPRMLEGTELTIPLLEALPAHRPRWVLDCRDPDAEQSDSPVGQYLRHGRANGIHEGYLTSRRRPWFRLERRDDPAILFTYFNRQQPRFVRNRAEAVPLNTWIAITPRDGVDADELFTALNRSKMFRQLHDLRRGYGGGMWKLEPRELGAVVLPRP